MLLFFGILMEYFVIGVTGWQCPNDEVIQRLYVKLGQPAILRFQTTLQTSSQSLKYSVTAFNNSNLYAAAFYNNVLQAQVTYRGSEFIGDAATGNFTVKIVGVNKQDVGVYFLQYTKQSVPTVDMCSMLFVFGKPQKAQVSHDNNNALGRKRQLSCSSVSTTYPTNHTTSFTYTWNVNDVTNPSNTRYSYSSSRKILTIIISKEDDNKRFKCSATETGDGVNGYTSDYSDEFILTVIYGPESSTTKLVPTNTEYTLIEGVPLNDITCVGDCYPSCHFKWTKPGTNGAVTVSSNAVLSLGPLSRTEATTYTCEVTNPSNTGRIERKEVIVIVNYKALVTSFFVRRSEGIANVTVNENANLQFVCTVESNPNSSIEINFQGKTLQRQDNTKTLTYSHDNVVCLDTGVYTCIAWNRYNDGKVSLKEMTLFVRCSPRPLYQVRRNFTSSLHTPVELSFTTLAYPEPAQDDGFLWYKENSFTWIQLLSNADLRILSSGLQSNLTIKNVSKADFGHYKVTVTNDIGKYEQYMFLIEEGSHTSTGNTVCADTCELAAVNTNWIITLGVLCAVLSVYAITVTVCLKRHLMCKEKLSHSVDKSQKQTTYANLSYNPGTSTGIEERGTQKSTVGKTGDENLTEQYTSLDRPYDDDQRAYDTLQNM